MTWPFAPKKRYAEAEIERLAPDVLKALMARWTDVVDRELKIDDGADSYVKAAVFVQVAATVAAREAWDRNVSLADVRRALHVTLDAQLDAIKVYLEREE